MKRNNIYSFVHSNSFTDIKIFTTLPTLLFSAEGIKITVLHPQTNST
jgi:hypothetical protein